MMTFLKLNAIRQQMGSQLSNRLFQWFMFLIIFKLQMKLKLIHLPSTHLLTNWYVRIRLLYPICRLSQDSGLVLILFLLLLYLHNIVQESTDTVKKFISTILPHEREEYVSSPFDQGTHLITTVAGVLQVSSFLPKEVELVL